MVANGAVSVSLDSVRDKNLMQLEKLNCALFPVRYNDKYYADALASHDFTKLVLDMFWMV
ncbi:putative transferase [Helianthus debilis subsp. tardiflorus]